MADKRIGAMIGRRDNTPAEAAQCVRDRKAGEQAHAEAMERFGCPTRENFQEMSDWQEARRRELLA